jgi:hypothetical protein
LLPQDAALLPCEEVVSDLIGPWTVNTAQESYKFYALTCIDTVTNFLLMPSDYGTKQPVTSKCNLRIFGLLDIQDRFDAYTIVAPNLWVPIFNEYYNVLASRMSPQAYATPNPMRYVSNYINQLGMHSAFFSVKQFLPT